MTSPIIDHDPNEPPRPTRGEAAAVTVITIVVLVSLALALKWLKGEYGLVVGLIGCGTVIILSFGLAAVLVARTKRHRA
jgi:hypothetical protein